MVDGVVEKQDLSWLDEDRGERKQTVLNKKAHPRAEHRDEPHTQGVDPKGGDQSEEHPHDSC